MRGRANLTLGLISSAWSAVIALAAVPFYLQFLGLEAYGLIGFFVALQSLFTVLDMGLSAAMNREVARCRAQDSGNEARDLLWTLQYIYWLSAVAIGLGLFLAAGVIADHWLQGTNMRREDVRNATALMSLVIGLRWPIALYAGALIGAHRLSHVSLITIVVATVTHVGAVIVLWQITPTIQAFFIWQALCALLHAVCIGFAAWREMGGHAEARASADGLKRIWRFSGGLSIAAIIGAVFMQSDKIVLSRIVSLRELGSYTLAATVARVLYLVLTPTFNVVYPRMTAMFAQDGERDLVDYYRVGTRLLIALIVPISTFISLFAENLLLLWTHNPTAARAAAPLVPPLIGGTVLNGIMHFPYALQLAAGESRLPATINLILLVLFLPLLAYLATTYGAMGGAVAWLGLNAGYVLLGTWLTHRTLLRGQGLRWLTIDVMLPLLLCSAITGGGSLLALALPSPALTQLFVAGMFVVIAMLVCAWACSPITSHVPPSRVWRAVRFFIRTRGIR